MALITGGLGGEVFAAGCPGGRKEVDGSMVIGSNGSYNLWGINWGYKPMVSRSIHGYNS